jgi:hypothetical protein
MVASITRIQSSLNFLLNHEHPQTSIIFIFSTRPSWYAISSGRDWDCNSERPLLVTGCICTVVLSDDDSCTQTSHRLTHYQDGDVSTAHLRVLLYICNQISQHSERCSCVHIVKHKLYTLYIYVKTRINWTFDDIVIRHSNSNSDWCSKNIKEIMKYNMILWPMTSINFVYYTLWMQCTR